MPAIIFPSLLLLPQFTIDNLGFTSTLAGMLIGVACVAGAAADVPVARLAGLPHFDLRWSIGGGLAVAGLGSLWLASCVTTNSDVGTFIPPLLLIGAGSAFVYSPLLVATMRAVAPEAAAKAAAFIVLFFQLGGSISSASIVAFLDRRLQFHQTLLAAQVTLDALPVAQFLQHGTPDAAGGRSRRQAAALSYADAFLVTGVLAFFVTPGVLTLSTQTNVRREKNAIRNRLHEILHDIAQLVFRPHAANVGISIRGRRCDARYRRGIPSCLRPP